VRFGIYGSFKKIRFEDRPGQKVGESGCQRLTALQRRECYSHKDREFGMVIVIKPRGCAVKGDGLRVVVVVSEKKC
jgi:hypothetical protein